MSGCAVECVLKPCCAGSHYASQACSAPCVGLCLTLLEGPSEVSGRHVQVCGMCTDLDTHCLIVCAACSVSMGALGSSAALRAAAATSLGLSNGMQASQLHSNLPPGLPQSTSLPHPSTSQPSSSRPPSAALTSSANPPVQSQPLGKILCYNCSTLLCHQPGSI